MTRSVPPTIYNVLANRGSVSWNDQTRAVVDRRLTQIPQRQFCTPAEWVALEAATARLISQQDRHPPIPIAPWIDEMLATGGGDGFRQPDEPTADDLWRRGLAGLDGAARAVGASAFAQASEADQDAILAAAQEGAAQGADWSDLDPALFFKSLLRATVGVYYAHPAAWSEMGFGGPAAPRGYVRLGPNMADPWEAPVRRG